MNQRKFKYKVLLYNLTQQTL